ncbi:hypothetical protein ACWDPG_29820, partial [Nocardia sp. NPDC003648]
ELLARLRDAGQTLIVISHDVADVTAVCDRTVHLDAGVVVETAGARRPVGAQPAPLLPGRPETVWRLDNPPHNEPGSGVVR